MNNKFIIFYRRNYSIVTKLNTFLILIINVFNQTKMSNIRVVYGSSLMRWLNLDGLVLYPLILISTAQEDTLPSTLKHEVTHVRQIERDGVCNFYCNYCIYICKDCYANNKYEQEAYSTESTALNQSDLDLLNLPTTFPKTDKAFRKQKKRVDSITR